MARRLGGWVAGVLVAAILLAVAGWVLRVCALHAKEHGHHAAESVVDVEPAQGADVKPRNAGRGRGHGRDSARGHGAGA